MMSKIDPDRLIKTFVNNTYKKVFGSPSFSMRRALERTSLLSVLFGYGLFLYVILTLQPLQRKQRQVMTFDHVKTTLQKSEPLLIGTNPKSSSQKSIDLQSLQRVLSDLSSYRLAIWMHPIGIPGDFVIPTSTSNTFFQKVPSLRNATKNISKSELGPIVYSVNSRHFALDSSEIQFHGKTWKIHLVDDITQEIEYQQILAWILPPIALIASLITILLTRSGIRRGLEPLNEFGRLIGSVTSGSLIDSRCESDDQPLELKPLSGSFNSLLDRLSQSWTRQRVFANALSHELRTPITLIIGYTKRVLRRSDSLTDELRHDLIIVDEETRRLGRLITDLLDIAREESGTLSINSQPFEAWKVLDQVYQLNQTEFGDRLLILSEKSGSDHLWTMGDRDRLVQCLGNLIENAFKYSPDDQNVEISCSSSKEYVQWKVRDHGPGVPEAEKTLIFEQFRRGSNTAKQQGSGIGLALVRSLLKPMGGRVFVQDATDGGALFVIELPRCESPQPEYSS